MKSITGIPGGTAPVPPPVVEPREPVSSVPATSESTNPQAPPLSPAPAEPRTPTREEMDAGVEKLREQLADLPGGDREVNLLYEEEDHTFVVEIRDKESGELIQQFPPEIVLNQDQQSADLLGTVVDRRS